MSCFYNDVGKQCAFISSNFRIRRRKTAWLHWCIQMRQRPDWEPISPVALTLWNSFGSWNITSPFFNTILRVPAVMFTSPLSTYTNSQKSWIPLQMQMCSCIQNSEYCRVFLQWRLCLIRCQCMPCKSPRVVRYYSQSSTHMRTRRLFRGSSFTPDGVKTAYVGGVPASQARYIDADNRLRASTTLLSVSVYRLRIVTFIQIF